MCRLIELITGQNNLDCVESKIYPGHIRKLWWFCEEEEETIQEIMGFESTFSSRSSTSYSVQLKNLLMALWCYLESRFRLAWTWRIVVGKTPKLCGVSTTSKLCKFSVLLAYRTYRICYTNPAGYYGLFGVQYLSKGLFTQPCRVGLYQNRYSTIQRYPTKQSQASKTGVFFFVWKSKHRVCMDYKKIKMCRVQKWRWYLVLFEHVNTMTIQNVLLLNQSLESR